MKVGVVEAFGSTPARGVDFLQEYAARAEALGFDSLWVPEHIVFFDTYESRYPYNEDGVLAMGADPGLFDPFLTLTAAAAATSTLRLGTSILLIGERNPLVTAREVATLDQLSGGRFELGVGVGWSREEYEALGVPWERRAQRCDEYIDVMRALWTTDRTTVKGEFCSFEDVAAFPKPVQSPHPPVLVGGNTPPALRRAAQRGDGWYGWQLPIEDVARCLASLDAELATAGRTREGFVLQVGAQSAGPPEEVAAYARRCADLGVDRFVLAAVLSRRTFAGQLEDYATAFGLSSS
jgi:probable F420-dependent oxidoreductase